MKSYGDLHMQQNYLKDAAIPLDTHFPAMPVVGQIVFTDRILYICAAIESNLPIWVPLTQTITSYTHYQSASSANWIIDHTLNTPNVSITVFDQLNRVVIPAEVSVNSATQVQVAFGSAAQGSVVIISGHQQGNEAPRYAFEYLQTNPSDTWVIVHGLGTYPTVRIFVGNQEVQPASITFDSINQVTVTFSTPQVGQAKLL